MKAFLREGSCPQQSFWSTLTTYLNYLVLTSTVPTRRIWQYGLLRKLLVQHKPECRMLSAKWNSGQKTGINENKTASMLFSLSTKPEQFRLKVNGHDIPASSTIKYLGVKFDQRLTWSKHILGISSRATLRMRILKKLAGTQWCANLKTLKQVYIGSVRPVMAPRHLEQQHRQHSRS